MHFRVISMKSMLCACKFSSQLIIIYLTKEWVDIPLHLRGNGGKIPLGTCEREGWNCCVFNFGHGIYNFNQNYGNILADGMNFGQVYCMHAKLQVNR